MPPEQNVLNFPSAELHDSCHESHEQEQALPIWLQRISLVVFVVFCVQIGLMLLVLPWTQVWQSNPLFMAYPSLRDFFGLPFVRGAISGLGLIDIWLGVREAVLYREVRPNPQP